MCKILSVLVIVYFVTASQSPCSKCDNTIDFSSQAYPPDPGPLNISCGSPQSRKRRQVTGSGACILPAYPLQGSYIVSGVSQATPGQMFDSFKLTVGCRRGYGFVERDGTGGTDPQTVYCSNGDWSQVMPKCVRFCKLNPDLSARYTCHVPGVGFKVCESFVPPGTRVRPVCNSPVYHATEGVQDMLCLAGYWDHVAKCKAECGRVTPKAEQLVVGGDRAKRGELPWHAGIYTKVTRPWMQICGGSLVSNNVVVSAAHCFWSDKKKLLPSSEYAVAIGKVYRRWDIDADFSSQRSDVKEIRIPSLFQGQAANLQEDIAALVLATPFVYKTYVRPVCLNFDLNFERWQLQHGKLGKVAGWGFTSAEGKASPLLKSVDMPYINDDVCINTLPLYFREYITGDKFCAGYTNGTALCQGDSGGGLAFGDKEFGIERFYLRGVVSAVPSDDDKLCNDYTYTTFTKISKHEEFIKEALTAAMNKTCPPYLFQCDDGACKDQGVDCNGRRDCADGSDESDELCVPNVNTTTIINNRVPSCELPQPDHSTYDVTNLSTDILILTVSCESGYGVENSSDYRPTDTLYCSGGHWSKSIPKCVRFCKLTPDSITRFLCQDTTTNRRKDCQDLIAPGTAVSPVCNTPGFSIQSVRNMQCVAGVWDYEAVCKAECGRIIHANGSTEELVSGVSVREAQRGDLPWLVLVSLKEYEAAAKCSGNLVTNSVVLTSSDCIQTNDANDYQAAVGKLYSTSDDKRDNDAQISAIKEMIVNPRAYESRAYAITVLTLVTPFVFNSVVKPICLSFDPDSIRTGQFAKSGVWFTESEDEEETMLSLNVVNVKYLNLDICRAAFSKLHASKTSISNMMCTAYPGARRQTFLYGGSGLYFPRHEAGVDKYYLHGLVSFIIPCYSNCVEDVGSYFVSTRLFDNKEFIQKYI